MRFSCWILCLFSSMMFGLAVSPAVADAPKTADAPKIEIVELQVQPTSLSLKGARDARHVLVSGKTADGKIFDLTPDAAYSIAGSAATLDEDHFVVPKTVGDVSLKITYGGKTASVPVKVVDVTDPPVSFIREIVPVMTKSGCNQGACHGGQQGKAGFKLSLRGYDPQYDYAALTDDLAGRRFNRASPEQSLMLLKPTQGVPHEGGFLFDEDSRYYHLIRRWIAEGCQFDTVDRVQSLEFLPKGILLEGVGQKQSHIVLAKYADGSSHDISRDVVYETSNFEKAIVDKVGTVTAVRRGEASILIRYEGAFSTNVCSVLGQREGYAWKDSPEFNFVDTHINNKLKRLKIQPAELCTDAEFLRRIMIDLTGVPPTSAETRAFLTDASDSHAKRAAKIEELLNGPDFIDYWTMKWSDLLMSNRKFITEKGVWSFRNWIRNSIATNTPYDKFVSDLITSNGNTFENPAANYYRISREPKLVMENMTQVFIGTRFMCNQCHDHPFERWTQTQYYELSAFFSGVGRKPGATGEEEVIFNQPNAQVVLHPKSGQPIAAAFPYTHAGVDNSLTEPREKLAQWLVSKENPYFGKSLANRYWSYFLGRGIIDPVDDIRQSNPPINGELLDALTKDFLDHDYDLKHLVRTIVSSHTYQRSIEANDFNRDDNVNFSHAAPRRLGAEQLYDAIIASTGSPGTIPGVPAGFRATQLPDGKVDLSFLDMFGRPPRESPCECERTSEVSLSQTLNLINGPTIGDAVSHPQALIGRLIAEKADNKKLVEEVYLSVFCRFPTAEEQQKGEAYLTQLPTQAEGAQDLMWALINSPAFLFNR
jgi:hypothetical protein